MTSRPFRIERLAAQDRSGFSCGVHALDDYLVRLARQDERRHVAACLLLIESETGRIAGYYTLSACHFDLGALSPEARRKLPHYPQVPTVRLGRLAVDLEFRGRKLGAVMLADSISRTLNADIGVHLMVVDAKDEPAAAFYRRHGFHPDPDEPQRLLAPIHQLVKLFGIN